MDAARLEQNNQNSIKVLKVYLANELLVKLWVPVLFIV